MFGKKNMTRTQKVTIERSNCYSCGFRIPVNNNPVMCLWGIMDDKDMAACNGRSHCDKYIKDTLLETHIRSIVKKEVNHD